MARTVRDANLGTRTARLRLSPSGQPYYRGLDEGLHIGYRKGKNGGKWVMRWRDVDTYKVETLGKADDTADADGEAILSYSEAQARAREKRVQFEREAKGLPDKKAGPYTVRHCLEEYLDYLKRERKSVDDARYRTEAIILPVLGDIVCADLTKQHIEKWRNDAARTAPRLRTKPGTQQRYRPIEKDDDGEAVRKRQSTINRTLTVLKAALNRAYDNGKIASDSAWRRAKPFKEADAARQRYLTVAECERLIRARVNSVI